MTAAIRRLDEATINQIAAGEVVERPASVIKELIENSLDAGARRLFVQVDRDCLAVADDGSGMSPGEMLLAVERHATSKIGDAGDLERLSTYGFRGEALPSIAAISELTIYSRRPDLPAGSSLTVRGGRLLGTAAFPMAPGTRVEVRDLFFNTPVRAKFLRSARTEQSRLLEAVERLALARPGVAFHCTLEGRTVLSTPGTGSHLETLLAIAGLELARAVRQASVDQDRRAVLALVGAPSTAAADRRRQAVWINQRPVTVRGPLEAAQAAYPQGLAPGRRYPLIYLFFDLPPEEVDANVHPTKAEVRLAAAADVAGLAVRAVRQAFPAREALATPGLPVAREAGGQAYYQVPGWPPEPAGTEGPPQSAPGAAPELRLLGQSGLRWLVADGPDGLYVIDQHAANERVIYEELAARGGGGEEGVTGGAAEPGQWLAVPATLELEPPAYPAWQEARGELARAGLVTEPFGGRGVLVRSVPLRAVGPGFDPAGFLMDVLRSLQQEEARGNALAPYLRARRAVASCAAAIKANQPLPPAEAQALLAGLARCAEPWRCPHGRPTMVRFGHDQLNRRFGRE